MPLRELQAKRRAEKGLSPLPTAQELEEFRGIVGDRLRAAIRPSLPREWGLVVFVDADGADSVRARVGIVNPSRDDLTYGLKKAYRVGEFTEADAVIMTQGALAAVAMSSLTPTVVESSP